MRKFALSALSEEIYTHIPYLRVFHARNVAQSPDTELADNM